jgi:hypothetical protein
MVIGCWSLTGAVSLVRSASDNHIPLSAEDSVVTN